MGGTIKAVENPKLSLNMFSPEDIQRLHTATLDVIENAGIRFPSKRAQEIWASFGAQVDAKTGLVKAPAHLIESALKKAPPVYSLAARDEKQDLPLDGKHVWVGTDGCGVEIIDLYTNERRRSKLQDVEEIARVADATEQVAFHWVALSAQDKPAHTRGLHEIAAVWRNSTKHVQTESIYSVAEAKAAVEMATALAGSKEALRKRPLLSLMQCTAPPLGHDGGSIDAALIGAEAGLPTGFMTMAACLTTGPATLAGNLVVGNAEVISGLALIQLAFPGAPVFYAAAQTASDLRNGAYTGGGPEDFLFGAANGILADFYNVPISMGSFATGAKEPNWQAGLENSLSTFMASIVVSDMLLGVGFLHGSRIWSFEQMLMDCEIYEIVRRTLAGIEVNDETLALETIKAVGPGGNFLTQKHTRAHMREIFLPNYLDRRPYNIWEEKKDGPRDWAREKARKLVETHQTDPLDPAITREFERIIAAEEA
jgi:trimethylamine--corrinoid protein Co-methyltransferase